MTSTNRPGREHRLITWLAHHRVATLLFWTLSILVRGVLGNDNPVATGMWAVGISMAMVSIFADVWHMSILCTRCAAEIPADGGMQAEYHMATLRYRHNNKANLYSWTSQLGLIALGVWWYPFMATAIGMQAAEHWALGVHRRLTPWCPWCKGWNDGDDTSVQPPVPTGQNTRS